MAKVRRRKKSGPTVVRRKVETSTLMEVNGIPLEDVRGAFVKVAPKIKASERDSFDGANIKKALLEAGARAVVLAPVVVPDTKRATAEKVAKAVSDREAVELWFSEQVGPEDIIEEAKQMVMEAMDGVGL